MDILFVIIAALVGWQHGRLGRHELKGIAVVVLGWLTVTVVSWLPAISLASVLGTALYFTVVVGGGYLVGVGLHRWRKRRR